MASTFGYTGTRGATTAYVTSSVAQENTWNRSASTLIPATSTDDVQIKGLSMDTFFKDNYMVGVESIPDITVSTNGSTNFSFVFNTNIGVRYIEGGVPKSRMTNSPPPISITNLGVMVFVGYDAVNNTMVTSTAPTLINYTTVVSLGTFIGYAYSTAGINWNPHTAVLYPGKSLRETQADIREQWFHFSNNGSVITANNSNQIAVSQGTYMFAYETNTFSAFNFGDTYTLCRYDGSSWGYIPSTSISRIAYNDITVGIVPMGVNRWNFHDIYVVVSGPNTFKYYLVMSQAEYLNVNAASSGANTIIPPVVDTSVTSVSNRFGCVRIGRIIFKTNATSPDLVISYLTTNAPISAPVAQHGLLSGLANDDHSAYLTLAGRGANELIKMRSSTGLDFNLDGDYQNGFFYKAPTSSAVRAITSVMRASTDHVLHQQGVNDGAYFVNHGLYKDGIGYLASLPNQYATTHFMNANGHFWEITPTGVLGSDVNFGAIRYPLEVRYTGIKSLAGYSYAVGATYQDTYQDNTGHYGYLSSLAAHKDIVPMFSCERLIYETPVKSYIRKVQQEDGTWISNTDQNSKFIEVGAIAEELETQDYDLFQHVLQYRDEANDNLKPEDRTNPPDWKLATIKYSSYIMPLVYTVQQLKKKVDDCTLRLNLKDAQIGTLVTSNLEKDAQIALLTSRLDQLTSRFDDYILAHSSS